ncbi:LysR substrate-binding domain-containing protein [Nonomuraea sp. NPDC049695]|uniref:LysR family transcriptional regulator n=1 Tax=Nonomuraea sp. NPDC049695 TaxID=3154734 RepID=UPI00342E4384
MRDIEIFLALAEELHFDRTTRAVRLTPLGEQLHRDLSAGYRQITAAFETATQAVRGTSGTLTVDTIGPLSLMISQLLKMFQTRYPGARLQHREIQPPSPLDLLRSGEVDVAWVWLPIHEPDLTFAPMHTSPVMLMVAATHPYAERDSICLEDLGDHCAQVSPRSIPAHMEEAIIPYRTPAGRLIPRGPKVSTWQEVLSAVSSGEAVAGIGAELARFYPWPSLAFVPIRDAPPIQWALVWRTTAESPLIPTLAQAVAEHRPAL